MFVNNKNPDQFLFYSESNDKYEAISVVRAVSRGRKIQRGGGMSWKERNEG